MTEQDEMSHSPEVNKNLILALKKHLKMQREDLPSAGRKVDKSISTLNRARLNLSFLEQLIRSEPLRTYLISRRFTDITVCMIDSYSGTVGFLRQLEYAPVAGRATSRHWASISFGRGGVNVSEANEITLGRSKLTPDLFEEFLRGGKHPDLRRLTMRFANMSQAQIIKRTEKGIF